MVRTRPSGRKKSLKMCHELGKPFPDGECFLAENNQKGQCHRSLGIYFYVLSADLAPYLKLSLLGTEPEEGYGR